MVSILALLTFFNPLGATPAEKARKRGDLVYDEDEERWIDLTEEDDPR
jgi:hypothetical protein